MCRVVGHDGLLLLFGLFDLILTARIKRCQKRSAWFVSLQSGVLDGVYKYHFEWEVGGMCSTGVARCLLSMEYFGNSREDGNGNGRKREIRSFGVDVALGGVLGFG